MAPKTAETWGFHVVPRRPSLGSLGFSCLALDGTTSFHILRHDGNVGFLAMPKSGGNLGFHDDANQLTSLGNLGYFKTTAQVWGTRCFHVAAHLESPESLSNFVFPCHGVTKCYLSLGCKDLQFGFHFSSQQKLLPKSGKRGVRTSGLVSPCW